MAVETCNKCRWWSGAEARGAATMNHVRAECRRHAPMAPLRITLANSYGDGEGRMVFPLTVGADWCGDFERLRTDASTPQEKSHETL